MDKLTQIWMVIARIMELNGKSPWDIEIERDKFFREYDGTENGQTAIRKNRK